MCVIETNAPCYFSNLSSQCTMLVYERTHNCIDFSRVMFLSLLMKVWGTLLILLLFIFLSFSKCTAPLVVTVLDPKKSKVLVPQCSIEAQGVIMGVSSQ